MKPRSTARVYVFDPAGRVLLLRFVVPRAEGPFVFWLTPGGEIEAGESPGKAAARELVEEVGVGAAVAGPVYTERNRFEHEGEMRDNTDYFFVARCEAEAPRLAGVTAAEIAVMREARWWSADEIAQAMRDGVRFFPADIVERVRELVGVSGG